MKVVFSVFLFVLCSLIAVNAEEVVTLTEENFQATISENEFVLVEFYAPWCGHCKSLAPEYEKAAVALKDFEPKVVIAKVDATAEETIAGEYGVQGFPTLKWFVNGKASDYGGGRVESEIVQWIKKKTGPSAVVLEDAAGLESFKSEADVVVVGLFKDEAQAKQYLSAAQMNDDTPFAIAYGNAAVETAAEATAPAVVLFRTFEEPRVAYEGDVTSSEEIAKFVEGNSLPLVIPFSQETAPKIFGGEIKVHVLVFIDQENEDQTKGIVGEATESAKSFKGEVIFVTIDKSDERILEFFGLKPEDIPAARIVNTADEGMIKYKYTDSEVTTAGLNNFVKEFQDGKLSPDLKSAEPLDESEQGDVFVVVGKNFDEVVNRPGVNVLVEFYAPWCGHCKKLEPEYEALAQQFKGNDKVLIAKMDSTENEVEAVSISGFPTLKFFPADSEEIVDYDGDRTTAAIKEFLDQQLA